MGDKGKEKEVKKEKEKVKETSPITPTNQRKAIDITVLSEVKNFDKLSKVEKRTKINAYPKNINYNGGLQWRRLYRISY